MTAYFAFTAHKKNAKSVFFSLTPNSSCSTIDIKWIKTFFVDLSVQETIRTGHPFRLSFFAFVVNFAVIFVGKQTKGLRAVKFKLD